MDFNIHDLPGVSWAMVRKVFADMAADGYIELHPNDSISLTPKGCLYFAYWKPKAS
jgi:Mn-dependent DtxR family transcriptional regulator